MGKPREQSTTGERGFSTHTSLLAPGDNLYVLVLGIFVCGSEMSLHPAYDWSLISALRRVKKGNHFAI